MNLPVVLGTAVILGVVAVLIGPWVRGLADRESAWTSRWVLALLAALGGAGAGALATNGAELVGFAALALGSAGLIAVDMACHRLPDKVMVPTGVALLLGLVVSAALTDTWPSLGRAALGGLSLGVGFLLIALASPRAIGLGDVKLALVLGLFLGWFGWTAVLAGVIATFVLGGLAALVLMAAGRATSKTTLAFGPWMVLGAAVGAAVFDLSFAA